MAETAPTMLPPPPVLPPPPLADTAGLPPPPEVEPSAGGVSVATSVSSNVNHNSGLRETDTRNSNAVEKQAYASVMDEALHSRQPENSTAEHSAAGSPPTLHVVPLADSDEALTPVDQRRGSASASGAVHEQAPPIDAPQPQTSVVAGADDGPLCRPEVASPAHQSLAAQHMPGSPSLVDALLQLGHARAMVDQHQAESSFSGPGSPAQLGARHALDTSGNGQHAGAALGHSQPSTAIRRRMLEPRTPGSAMGESLNRTTSMPSSASAWDATMYATPLGASVHQLASTPTAGAGPTATSRRWRKMVHEPHMAQDSIPDVTPLPTLSGSSSSSGAVGHGPGGGWSTSDAGQWRTAADVPASTALPNLRPISRPTQSTSNPAPAALRQQSNLQSVAPATPSAPAAPVMVPLDLVTAALAQYQQAQAEHYLAYYQQLFAKGSVQTPAAGGVAQPSVGFSQFLRAGSPSRHIPAEAPRPSSPARQSYVHPGAQSELAGRWNAAIASEATAKPRQPPVVRFTIPAEASRAVSRGRSSSARRTPARR